METTQQENKMGILPINKLLIGMALPMMISMLVQALYNVVDSIYVSRVNENALTALSLVFPLQNLMIGFGTGIGVGVNALLSRRLGEKDRDGANRVAMQGIFVSMCCVILFVAGGLLLPVPFMHTQTQNSQIFGYGVSYLQIIMIGCVGMFTQFVMERLLISTGRTILSMIAQATGAIINIVLDPIFIFGLDMGVAGAALATIVGQIIAGILGLILNLKLNSDIHLSLNGFRPDWDIIKNILRIGIPSVVMVAIGSAMTFGLNLILMGFTSTAAAVFGVYFKLQSFVFMPVFGLNNAVVPIVAYNYGARKKDRMLKTVKLGAGYAVCIMLIGLCIVQIAPRQILMIFDASENMMEIGVVALRVISLCWILAGFCIVCGSVFQALGNSIYSTLVAFARQLLVLLPVAWILAQFGSLSLVWLAFPIAELISLGVTILLLMRINKNVLMKMEVNETVCA